PSLRGRPTTRWSRRSRALDCHAQPWAAAVHLRAGGLGTRSHNSGTRPALISPEAPKSQRVRFRGNPSQSGYDRATVRIPFLVTLLLALAAVGTALGLAFYMNLITIPTGGVATASQTPRSSFAVPSVVVTPSPAPSAPPSAPPTPGFSPGGTYTVKPGDSLSL